MLTGLILLLFIAGGVAYLVHRTRRRVGLGFSGKFLLTVVTVVVLVVLVAWVAGQNR